MLVLTLDMTADDSLARVQFLWIGRLITGPLAFAAAGFADLLIYWAGALRDRAGHRGRSARGTGTTSTIRPG
jgi:hypothetical protein